MAKLKFEKDSSGNDAKIATGMYSKDGEYVDMDSSCDLSGQVRDQVCAPVHMTPTDIDNTE